MTICCAQSRTGEAHNYRSTGNLEALGLLHATAAGAVQLREREHTRMKKGMLDREIWREEKKSKCS